MLTTDSHGSVKLSTEGPYGLAESCTIALHGATVISYTTRGIERLFVSTKSKIHGPAAIRGGVPICWPVFGPPPADQAKFSKLKQHGFARTATWSLDDSKTTDDRSGVSATFYLESSADTLALYDAPFRLEYTVKLEHDRLALTLKVVSPKSSTIPLEFQALLHAYIKSYVLPSEVTVTPLGGLEYIDKVQGGARSKEQRAVVNVDGPNGEVDRVYLKAPDKLEVNFGGNNGRLEVTKEGLEDVVLWNPGETKGAAIADMEEGGVNKFICLEPGQIGSFVALKAGESWEGKVVLAFSS